jgi:glucose dehydrogenase
MPAIMRGAMTNPGAENLKNLAIAALAAAAIATGCAMPDAHTSTEAASAREYPTGSNIPRKSRDRSADGVRTHSREDLERIQSGGHGVPAKGSGL